MGWEDEDAVGRLIDEGRALLETGGQPFIDAMLLASEAAESLEPEHPRLLFEALFFLQSAYLVADQHARCFATGMRLIALSERTELDMDEVSGRIALVYTMCAVAAVELPAVQSEALGLLEAGLRFCRMHCRKKLLYLQHEYSKLLILGGLYDRALVISEQIVAERRLAGEETSGCELACYQRVYAQALGFAVSWQAGIDYLNEALPEEHSWKLWYARAELRLRAGDYTAALADSEVAVQADESEDTLLRLAFSHSMLGQQEQVAKVLESLVVLGGPYPSYQALWQGLLTADMSRLQLFKGEKGHYGDIIRYILGDISLESLLQAAAAEESPECCIGQACCFAALQMEVRGKYAQAKEYYEKTLQHSNVLSDEYLWADMRRRSGACASICPASGC